MEDRASQSQFDPTAVPLEAAVAALSKVAGKPITSEMIRQDIEEGAPTNDDGTINLVHYAAWILKENASYE